VKRATARHRPPARGDRLRAFWRAATGSAAAASLVLAVLVLVGVFVAVALPRASLGYRTRVLQRIFHAAPSTQTTVLADADISGQVQSHLSAPQLASIHRQLATGLYRDGLPLAPPGTQWSGLAAGSSQFSVAGQPPDKSMGPPQLELLYRSTLAGNAKLVAGSLPGAAAARGPPGPSGAFQVAVTTATAARFGLHVGSRLRLPSRGTGMAGATAVVIGVIRPLGAASSFWSVDPLASAPRLTYPCGNGNCTPYWDSAAFVGPAQMPAAQQFATGQSLHALWSFPLDLGGVDADQAAGLQHALEALSYLPAASSVSSSISASAGQNATVVISLSSGLVPPLQSFVATDDAVQRVLSLLLVSLAVIAAVMVLLGARLVAEHRRGEFIMMRARGASLRQVAAVAFAGSAIVVVPATAVAIAAGVLTTPGPDSWLSWWLAGLIIVTALASPAVLAAWWQRARRDAAGAGGVNAAGARRRIMAARRWVFDAALVCAAAAGLVLLRQQGLPPPGQLDLFTSAAPVLVAIPVAVLVMRAYPPVLGQLTRLARRRRGVVMVVGFARGNAEARVGALPVFALVLAFTVIAFAAMARDAVLRADIAASWQAAGADAVVTAPAAGPGITPAAQRLITAVPGVERSATVSVTPATAAQSQPLSVILVDPRQYATLVAVTPAPVFPAAALAAPRAGGGPPGGRVPALISPAARHVVGARSTLSIGVRQLPIRVTGTVAGIVGMPAGSQFAVLPLRALGKQALQPTVIAVVGSRLDTAALVSTARRAIPGVQITLRSHLLAGISAAPLPHGGFVTFAQGIAAVGAFSLLILMLTLVLSARSRELTMARLATMGLGPAQSRRIAAAETLPAILAVAVGGTACALALVPLVGPAMDLAAFTGLPVTAPLHADAPAILIAIGGLLLVAALTLSIQNRLARGRGAAQALRAGP
jgi:putative ABC transport system permease protein